MSEWEEPVELGEEEDPGFVGGGGPAELLDDDDVDDELDEHGDNLSQVDDDEL